MKRIQCISFPDTLCRNIGQMPGAPPCAAAESDAADTPASRPRCRMTDAGASTAAGHTGGGEAGAG